MNAGLVPSVLRTPTQACSQHDITSSGAVAQWQHACMDVLLPLHKCCSPSGQVLGDWVKSHTLDEVTAAMKEARVPAGPILSTADIFKEEQFQQRDMFETATAPEGEARQ